MTTPDHWQKPRRDMLTSRLVYAMGVSSNEMVIQIIW